MSARIGETFGRYQLLGLLGQGGMGRLYIAERRGIQGFVKIVALKRILPHLADSAQLRRCSSTRRGSRPGSSTRTSSRLRAGRGRRQLLHQHGVPARGGSVGDHRRAARPSAACRSRSPPRWHSRPRRAPLRPRGARRHRAAIGLVHRDVNPRNIFVTYHGVVKLLDFGVVRGRERRRASPGVFKGKYGYCAPEQIEGGRRSPHRRLLSRHRAVGVPDRRAPVRRATDAATIDAVRSRTIEAPSALRPEIPPPSTTSRCGRCARSGRALPERARHVRGARSLPVAATSARPAKSVGRGWSRIFGTERASLKKAISQGGEVETAARTFVALNAIRPASDRGTGAEDRLQRRPVESAAAGLWSTNFGSHPSGDRRAEPSCRFIVRFIVVRHRAVRRRAGATRSRTPPTPTRAAAAAVRAAVESTGGRGQPAARKSTMPIVLGVGLVLAGIAAVAAVALRGERSSPDSSAGRAARATATLEIQSQPAGAHVFVDGSPSGLHTPAVLNGITAGSKVQVRLDKAGYEPATEQVHPGRRPEADAVPGAARVERQREDRRRAGARIDSISTIARSMRASRCRRLRARTSCASRPPTVSCFPRA